MTRKRLRTPSPTSSDPSYRAKLWWRYNQQRDTAAKDIQRAFYRYKKRKERKGRQQGSPGYKALDLYRLYGSSGQYIGPQRRRLSF
jgi:hypothetical protein